MDTSAVAGGKMTIRRRNFALVAVMSLGIVKASVSEEAFPDPQKAFLNLISRQKKEGAGYELGPQFNEDKKKYL